MKVSIARIRLYLKEGKTLSDGTNPQYIKELSEEGDLVDAVSIL